MTADETLRELRRRALAGDEEALDEYVEALSGIAPRVSVPLRTETAARKQVIVVRKDLKMRTGKLGAQVAHASMKVLLDAGRELRGAEIPEIGAPGDDFFAIPLTDAIRPWLCGIFTKIVVGVEGETELLAVHARAKEAGLLAALVQDVGKTEFHGVPTYTAVAVGPDEPGRIDAVTGYLKLL